MSPKAYLQSIADQARALLECSCVSLCLLGADGYYSQPLFSQFPSSQHYGTILDTAFFASEPVAALCDIVQQTRKVWCIDHLVLSLSCYQEIASIAVAPLEGSKGLVGLLVFMDARAQAFLCGECLLIEQYRLIIGKNVEKTLQVMVVRDASALGSEIVTDVQEQSEFIALVSHELRTPLTDIKGYAELLQAYAVLDQQMHQPASIMKMTAERQQQYLNVIVEQANHLEVLIGDLLDVSRLRSHRLALHQSWVDIGELCQRVAQIVQDKVERQQPGYYRICCKREADLPLAWADPHRVQQVLVNLLENAVKYSPDGGVIEIHISTINLYTHQMLCVAVHDQGIGVPSQQQVSLFRLFTRLDHPRAGRITGTGLGLYISRKLVEAMNGRVALQSHEGEGTRITFTLPTFCSAT